MMFTTKNLIALPLLHFSQNSIAILQYFNKLDSYWNIAIYCNNSIICNLLQYKSIKQRSGTVILWSFCWDGNFQKSTAGPAISEQKFGSLGFL